MMAKQERKLNGHERLVVGSLVRVHRKAKGWTQSRVASQLRLSDALISQIETGTYPHLHMGYVRRLAKALEVGVDELLPVKQPLLPDGWMPLAPRPSLWSRFKALLGFGVVAGVLALTCAPVFGPDGKFCMSCCSEYGCTVTCN